jgi:SAM-dependent methyltransferase
VITIADEAARGGAHRSTINIIEVNCRHCGGAQKERVASGLRDVENRVRGDYDISKCLTCNLVYLSRTPDNATLGASYPESYHTRANRPMNLITRLLYRLKKRTRLNNIEAGIGSPPNSFLEVGCGDGSFLVYVEEQWPGERTLVGTDLSCGNVKVPRGSKVLLVKTSAEKLDLGQQFDVVVMHQVLEHLPSPVEGLRRIFHCLKPGGILIGEVPNWDSPWRRVFSRHWGGLQIPRHQSFFDSLSLDAMLHSGGLRLERIVYTADPGDLGVSLCNWISDTFRLKTLPRHAWFFIPLMIAAAPVVWLQTKLLPKTGGLEFHARKGHLDAGRG